MPKQDKAASISVDNAGPAKSAKIAIRRNVMAALGCPARVFDAFAGSGEFYRKVWRDAERYVGCDRRYFPDERVAFVADNRRVLRAVDLAAFNLFDLDAYGAPWEQAIIIAARRKAQPSENVGFTFTEGNGLNYKNNSVPRSVVELIGLRNGALVGLHHRREEIHAAILAELARRMGATVTNRWQAIGRTGAAVAYMGVVMRGASERAHESSVTVKHDDGADQKIVRGDADALQ